MLSDTFRIKSEDSIVCGVFALSLFSTENYFTLHRCFKTICFEKMIVLQKTKLSKT